ncbi:MAG: ABC transporter ATP-binding protein [Ruminococcaceae bacterium]|nr:ABC transporter ATP-binding protein [Oscillospiraceae bacterium]
MNILTITDLKKSFGQKEVLNGLSLSVPENSVFGFVGRNGAGKTTAMKAVLGLLKPDAGEITVSGEKVFYGQTPTNRYVGYLPDVPEFYSFMTPSEYLHLCGESLGMDNKDIKSRSAELLSMVGLENEKSRIKGFSRGMKQRLGIAQALIGRPKLLICDEPTSALDPLGRKEILDILLCVKNETTVFFSTHILSDVERICTDIALLNDGKIAIQLKPDDLKKGRDSGEFSVELINSEDALLLSEAFEKSRIIQKDTVLFSGEEDRIFQVMGFIKENKMRINKLERNEITLESLFLEVIGK